MKKKITSIVLFIIIMAVIVTALTILFPYELTLQYVQDGELITETFTSTSDLNERTNELKAQGITYYKD